ncbi:MAG: acyltransferase [Geodermatophilaceae bacterium]
MRKLKVLLVLAVGLLPASRRKNGLLNRLGHQVHPTARIAPIVLLRVRTLRVGAGTTIGFMNKLRGLRLAEFGEETQIGPHNDFRASRPAGKISDEPEFVGVLKVGKVVFISKRHEIDCTGGVLVGDWAGMGGRNSFIYSHSYDPQRNVNTCGPTRIGRNSFIATKTILAKGATLPEGSILAMGAVLMPGASKTHTMYGGVPAKPLSVDITNWAFQQRTSMTPRNTKGTQFVPAELTAD